MARSGRAFDVTGCWLRDARSWSRSGRRLARGETSELPGASSQRDSPASINTPLTLSLRGWREGCGRRGWNCDGVSRSRQRSAGQIGEIQAAGPRNPRCEAQGVEGTAAVVRLCACVVVAPAPAGGHLIEGDVGSSLPRNPRCEAMGVKGVAATGDVRTAFGAARLRLRLRAPAFAARLALVLCSEICYWRLYMPDLLKIRMEAVKAASAARDSRVVASNLLCNAQRIFNYIVTGEDSALAAPTFLTRSRRARPRR